MDLLYLFRGELCTAGGEDPLSERVRPVVVLLLRDLSVPAHEIREYIPLLSAPDFITFGCPVKNSKEIKSFGLGHVFPHGLTIPFQR